MLGHLSPHLIVLHPLGRDLGNDLLKIFFLWESGDSSTSQGASLFTKNITEINENILEAIHLLKIKKDVSANGLIFVLR